MARSEVGMQSRALPGDETPERPIDATPEEADGSQAGKATTLVLAIALILVVVMTGVLGAVAVLMTRNQNSPPLTDTPVRRLTTPMHFAPVTGVRAAPCPGTDAVQDDAGTTCYQLDKGITVTTVQKIEPVAERDGTYSIRLVLSPGNRQDISDLTHDALNQQLAIVVGDHVVAAPRVAQEITQDSLSIAGFTKQESDALLSRLVGTGTAPVTQPPVTPPPVSQPPASTPPTAPAATQPGAVSQPAGTQPASRQTGGTGARYASCKEANEHGAGPYTRGVHKEYYFYDDVDNDGVACDPDDISAN